jgi:hypothetical protein
LFPAVSSLLFLSVIFISPCYLCSFLLLCAVFRACNFLLPFASVFIPLRICFSLLDVR